MIPASVRAEEFCSPTRGELLRELARAAIEVEEIRSRCVARSLLLALVSVYAAGVTLLAAYLMRSGS